jgi:hypothetical protein
MFVFAGDTKTQLSACHPWGGPCFGELLVLLSLLRFLKVVGGRRIRLIATEPVRHQFSNVSIQTRLGAQVL